MKGRKSLVTVVALVLTLAMAGMVLAEDANPGTINTNAKVMGLAPTGTTSVVAEYWAASGARHRRYPSHATWKAMGRTTSGRSTRG